MLEGLQSFDTTIFFLVNRVGQNAFFDWFMPIMSNLKNFYALIIIAWILMMVKGRLKTRVVAVAILLLVGVSEWTSSDVLKPAFERPRPYHQLSNVHHYSRGNKTWHVTPELTAPIHGKSQSLPSSHATNMFAAAFFLSFYFRKYWPLFLALALTVGYSRIYLGVHFPLDVLGGAITGTLCALIFVWLTSHVIRFLETKTAAHHPQPESRDS